MFSFFISSVKSPACKADFGRCISDGSKSLSLGGLDFLRMMLLTSAAGSRGEGALGKVDFGETPGDCPLLVLRYSCLSYTEVTLAVCSCNDVLTGAL